VIKYNVVQLGFPTFLWNIQTLNHHRVQKPKWWLWLQ